MHPALKSPPKSVVQGKQLSQKIVLVKGGSQYDVLRVFIDHLAEAFQELGENIAVIDLNQEDYIEDMKKISGGIKFFISFNGNGLSLMCNDKPLYDVINVPVVSWFVDHPFYHWDRITYALKQRLFFFSNQNSFDFYFNYLRKPATVGSCLQLAGRQVVKEIVPIAERPYDLVFFGSCLSSLKEAEEKLDYGNKILNAVVWETVEQGKFETERELHHIFFERMEAAGLYPLELAPEKMGCLLSDIDRYIRIYRRNHVLKALGDSPITIFGNGWEQFEHRTGNMTFLPAVSFTETPQIMGQSKVVLNIMPNNRAGIHERLPYAMHQGAACLSEDIPGLRGEFEHGKNIFNFQLTPHLADTFSEQIRAMLGDLDQLQQIADAGRSLVNEKHHWRHRAQMILDALEVHKVAMLLK